MESITTVPIYMIVRGHWDAKYKIVTGVYSDKKSYDAAGYEKETAYYLKWGDTGGIHSATFQSSILLLAVEKLTPILKSFLESFTKGFA